MLRRWLVSPGRDEQSGLPDPVGFEFLDDDAIEERAKVVAHFCVSTLRMASAPANFPLHWTRLRLRGGGLAVVVQRGAGLVALAVAIAFGSLIVSAHQQRSDARAVAASAETVAQLARVERLALDLESGLRGYVITGQEPFLAPYWDARDRYGAETQRLAALVDAHPAERTLAARLLRDSQDYALDYGNRVIGLERRGGQAAIDLVTTQEGKRRMDAIRGELALLRSLEQQRIDALREQAERNAARAIVFGVLGLAGSLALLWAVVVFLRRRVTTPIGRVAAAARRLERGESGVTVLEDGPREVAQLAHSFNQMSDGLKRRGEDIERARTVAEHAEPSQERVPLADEP